jgi:tetratricopeptide (TPR) repeat protein
LALTTASDAGQKPIAGLVLVILMLIGALFGVDRFLASVEQREIHASADRLYHDGSRLLHEGRTTEAVEALRTAYSLDRSNHAYQLQLVAALTAAGKLEAAETTLNDLLQRDPNNAEANLLGARLMVKEGQISVAESYYHRAIYGAWRDDATSHRVQVRMELIDFLASHGQQKELLAEVLPLDAEAPSDNPALRKRIAHLYLLAESPERAVTAYQALLQHDPKDSEAYAGLGEAQLALGNYRAARAEFQNALHRNPADEKLRWKLELSSTMEDLDPTPRRLRSMEKYERSMHILELARQALRRCSADNELLATADKILSKRAPPFVTNELAEDRLNLAEQLWHARIQTCGAATTADEEPLRLIIEKLK